MPRRKKVKTQPVAKERDLPQLRRGMPALDNVEEVADFVSPQGDKYKILKTSETDAYDPPLPRKKPGASKRGT